MPDADLAVTFQKLSFKEKEQRRLQSELDKTWCPHTGPKHFPDTPTWTGRECKLNRTYCEHAQYSNPQFWPTCIYYTNEQKENVLQL